jgi:sulfate permease, SulP family
LVIGFSQLKHLLGIKIPQTESFLELLQAIALHVQETNPVPLALGVLGIGILIFFNQALGRILKRRGVSPGIVVPLTRIGPLLIVVVSTLLVWGLGLHQRFGVKIVGDIPAGLPPLTLPVLNWTQWQLLLPTALTISFVGFMESIAVAQSLASKRRQKIDANQELLGLGAANIGAAFTGGYPVTGGFSRSGVNFAAGANTGLASIITAFLIALTVLFLTPLFYFLPQTILAAIILVAVAGLIDLETPQKIWRYNKADAASLILTFLAVLLTGIETGNISAMCGDIP